jgi:hypothetical protein
VPSSSPRRLLTLCVVSFLAGLLLGQFVHEHRYDVVTVNGATLRIDRDHGVGHVLDPDRGWVPIPGPPPPYEPPYAPRPNPFADLAAAAARGH